MPTVNNIPMVRMVNPIGERMSTPPMTCDACWGVEKTINLLRMPNLLLDYFLQDIFAIFLN